VSDSVKRAPNPLEPPALSRRELLARAGSTAAVIAVPKLAADKGVVDVERALEVVS
jgi:hypothetical protein